MCPGFEERFWPSVVWPCEGREHFVYELIFRIPISSLSYTLDVCVYRRRKKDKQPELSLIGDQLCTNNSAEEDYAPETNDNREPKLDSVNDEKSEFVPFSLHVYGICLSVLLLLLW